MYIMQLIWQLATKSLFDYYHRDATMSNGRIKDGMIMWGKDIDEDVGM